MKNYIAHKPPVPKGRGRGNLESDRGKGEYNDDGITKIIVLFYNV